MGLKEFCECSPNWTMDILNKFYAIISATKNKKGIRLQRSKFIVMYRGLPYTFTIERGDRLNDRSVD